MSVKTSFGLASCNYLGIFICYSSTMKELYENRNIWIAFLCKRTYYESLLESIYCAFQS